MADGSQKSRNTRKRLRVDTGNTPQSNLNEEERDAATTSQADVQTTEAAVRNAAVEAATQQAEAAKQRAEAATQQAEAAKQRAKAEEERAEEQRAEAAKQRAEAEEQRKELERAQRAVADATNRVEKVKKQLRGIGVEEEILTKQLLDARAKNKELRDKGVAARAELEQTREASVLVSPVLDSLTALSIAQLIETAEVASPSTRQVVLIAVKVRLNEWSRQLQKLRLHSQIVDGICNKFALCQEGAMTVEIRQSDVPALRKKLKLIASEFTSQFPAIFGEIERSLSKHGPDWRTTRPSVQKALDRLRLIVSMLQGTITPDIEDALLRGVPPSRKKMEAGSDRSEYSLKLVRNLLWSRC